MISWYSTAFRSLSMILLVPMVIFIVYFFIDITMHGIHTGYIVIDRSSSLLTSASTIPNQKLILGIFEKRNQNNGRQGISKAPSLIIIEHPQSMSVQSRTEVTFNCEATSRDYGNVTYLWQRVDGRELDVSRTTGINSNKLTISNVMSGDAGSYVCVASNKDAEIISRNILHIKVHCPTNLLIPNGIVKFSEDGTSVTYHCADNFKPVGSASAVCESDGTWSSPPPKCIAWKGCQLSKIPSKLTEIAERVAADPFELSLAANYCHHEFHLYFQRLPKSTVNNLCQKLQVSKLTSPLLQYKFMHCTGLMLYRFFLDSNGNVQVPKPFHNCKKMSFRGSGTPTMLVSFPGSGNSWVRQLLESTTGIYTGSDRDCDLDYIKIGMLGEGITSEKVIAVKFHWGSLPRWPFKKVIYIIRNPYDALVAEYQRFCAAAKFTKRTKLSINPHVSELGIDKFGDNKYWKNFVYQFSGAWKQHVQRWLSGRLPFGSTILVVKFEDLLTDLRTELIRMMKYLEYPYTEEDLNCTIKSNTHAFHRSHDHSKDVVEHFTQSEVDVIHRQIQQVDRFLKNYKIVYKKHMLQN